MPLTPSEIFEEKIASRLKAAPQRDINATYQFDIEGENGGQWYIILNDTENKVEKGSLENPNCVITLSEGDLINLVQGNLNPQLAFMTGKLRVKGDIALALRLGSLLKA